MLFTSSHYVLRFCGKVLSSGRQKWLSILDSISTREEAVAGGVAIAAAFATYLGPYSFTFRREMLTLHWPECLEERGVMLVLDSSAPYPNAEVFRMERLQKRQSSNLPQQQDNEEGPELPNEERNSEIDRTENGKV